ncbi:MAG TPA: NADH-quinone oxidoreductase subunit C [Phototrophicaceae bacterium]|nr:NADH-quinone oxidoreductase subunit C [Phototrophicaceae bacterium]
MTLDKMQDRLKIWAEETQTPEANRLDVTITVGNLLAAVAVLKAEGWYLSAITGLDYGHDADRMEVLYHFCFGAETLTLRVSAPHDTPSVPSICHLIPPAVVFERELAEMFGIVVVGIPNSDHLFLPDDWDNRVFPLRKDARLE